MPPLGKFLRSPMESGLGAILTKVCRSLLRSFSKLNLIKTFHRSTVTDERLTNLAMISIESETAEILDTTELTKAFAFLKTWKKSFS